MKNKRTRRDFIKLSALTAASLPLGKLQASILQTPGEARKPVVLSTWKFGIEANEGAWKVLSGNGRALDAVEAGVRVTEGDPKQRSVGLGGRPDRDGRVTLDACIMDEKSNIGSVACLEHIMHPVSVARMVMEQTPHVMLVGDGALSFALSKGFKKEKVNNPENTKEYNEWLKENNYKPPVNIENHDTIGMIAIDANGDLSGAVTTSGLAYKMHGRVGDAPIIGAGLFVDNEVGAAAATGHGEEVVRIAGCHLVVEIMKQGKSPGEACRMAVERIVKSHKLRNKNITDTQVGFLALNKMGEHGAYSVQTGFMYALHDNTGNRIIDSEFHVK